MPKIPTSLARPGLAARRPTAAPVSPHGGTPAGPGSGLTGGGPDGSGEGGRTVRISGAGLSGAYLRAVADRLDSSTSAGQVGRKAQFIDYESMRAMFEAWNSQARRGAGGPTAMPHPSRHVAVWPVCHHGLDVSGGYYGARKGCEPLHVQADPSDGTVLAANHTPSAVRGATVRAQLHDLGGRPIGAPVVRTVDVAAGTVAEAFAVPFERSLPATHLLRLRLTAADGRVLSANDYWRYRTATDMRSINGLPNVRLCVAGRPAGPAALTATVVNTGSSPAAMVRLSLAAPQPGGPALPALADDNYLWLLPGESRDVTLSWAAQARDAGTPTVVAQAYNALPVTG